MLESNEAPLRARDGTSIGVAGYSILDLFGKQVCSDECQLSTVDLVRLGVLGVGSVQTLLPKARCPFNDVSLPSFAQGKLHETSKVGPKLMYFPYHFLPDNCMGSVSDSCEL